MELYDSLRRGEWDGALRALYGEAALKAQRQRYLEAVEAFSREFPGREAAALYSAPGRTEVGGNHTDHQHGRVLAAAVDLDVIAVVAPHDEPVIRLQSKGFARNEVRLDDLSVHEAEREKSNGLIRGIAARFAQLGHRVGGFDAYTTSSVLKGSGLSSSAAFEVLVGTILSRESCAGAVDAVEIAKIGQYAENHYFGKASGLMDQTVSSVGGFVSIDFADPETPAIGRVPFDFAASGHALCITDTRGSHADLTADYVSVPAEMKQVAALLGKEVLRQVPEEEFYRRLPELRGKVSDRALLRAAHFFAEDRRAAAEADALRAGDFAGFLALVRESGASSFQFLQNVYSPAHPEEQGLSLALLASGRLLGGRGACRVHGGGFAGTIQAFVPEDLTGAYRAEMDRLFGAGACHVLNVRQAGGVKLERK